LGKNTLFALRCLSRRRELGRVNLGDGSTSV
jgi:hypothetical protein